MAGASEAGGKRRGGAVPRDRLASRRKSLGLTQEDLAALLKVGRSTVVRWERGETDPQPWIRLRLAKTLRVSPDRLTELLGGGSPDAAASGGPGRDTGPADGADHGKDKHPPGRGAADSTTAMVPRQLPLTVPDFTGRAAELTALTEILDRAGNAPGTVVISAIGGTAGIGKTTLALHWAHQVADRFPDGQLHVNLRGFDPTGTPTAPEAATRGFLDALGVPPERIPAQPDAQAALYRSLVADRRMLIVLDNARDEAQVRSLLPAAPGSLVLVTSRAQLSGLAAADGARIISLDVLTSAEAIALLTARIGASRCAGEPEAVAAICDLCAFLPLALAVTAARAAALPRFPLSALAAELRDAGNRLDALDADGQAANVRAVFSWSYDQLDAAAARLFRLLGLHPGPEISIHAAASLGAVTESEGRRLLRELTRAHLIIEHASGRYAFHDLLRAYAADQAQAVEDAGDCAAATNRFLDYYLHTAQAACHHLAPTSERIVLPPPATGTMTKQIANYRQAMEWSETEHHVLLASIASAYSTGFDRHAWQLASVTMQFLRIRGHFRESVTIASTALAAATRLDDTTGQAISHRILANACVNSGAPGQAHAHYTASLELYRRLGNRLGEAKVHQNLSVLATVEGRHAEGLGHDEHALRLYRAIGYRAGEAEILNSIGWHYAELGDFQRARQFSRQALAIYRESSDLGIDRNFEGYTWDTLGYAEYHLGNFSEASACFKQALGIARELGDRRGEAEVLLHLGDAHQAASEVQQARDAWQRALAILDDLAHHGADEVRAKLASLAPDES